MTREMNKELLLNIGISIIMIAILICIALVILSQIGIQINQSSQVTSEKCCQHFDSFDTGEAR